MDALDWIGGGGDRPEHLEEFVRLRAQQRADDYNPDALIDDWSLPPLELPILGAWASASSAYSNDAVREQLLTSKQIAVFDPNVDVREGDRIRTADGAVFTVTGRPERDKNPWTGWQPTALISVEEGVG